MDGRTVLWTWAEGLPEGASVGATLAALRAVLLEERRDTPGAGEVRAVYDAVERGRRSEPYVRITDDERERGRRHLASLRRQLHQVA